MSGTDAAVKRPVITVTPTIMDGQVVRWFHSLHAAENMQPVVTASRNGITVDTNGVVRGRAEVDALKALIEEAHLAAYALERGTDCRDLATHVRGGWTGPLVPVFAATTEAVRP